MTLDPVTLTAAEARGEFGQAWDRIAEARGLQADIYASHVWFDAWVGANPLSADLTVVPAVLEDGNPLAVLPLVRQRWVWHSAGLTSAPRTRPALAAERPEPAVLAQLVDQVARSGVRELLLYRLPTRDPATVGLIGAMREAGLEVAVHERSSDNVVEVDGNEALPRSLRKLASSTRSRERRIAPYWELAVERFGGRGRRPIVEGLAMADLVQERSWKGPSRETTRHERRALLQAADKLGWARLLVLTIDGRPVATNTFFKMGGVAVGLSTAYEQRFAALSPGIILHGHVQEEIFAESPRLVDMLPGASPFKEQFGAVRPPLVTVEACRRTVVRGASFPLRRRVRRHAPRVRSRMGAALESLREGRSNRAQPQPQGAVVVPAPADPPAVGGVVALEAHAPFRRYLAVVYGAPSAEAVAEGWGDGDQWWLVEEGGRALVRTSPPGAGDQSISLRDVVPLRPGTSVTAVASAVAGHLNGPVTLRRSCVASEAELPPLPWHPGLVGGGTAPT